MSVKDAVRTVTVPHQGGPADPPLVTAAPAPGALPRAGVPGRDRSLTVDERQFLVGASITFGGLAIIIVTFLLLATQVW